MTVGLYMCFKIWGRATGFFSNRTLKYFSEYFEVLVSRMERKYISVVLRYPVYGTLSLQCWEINKDVGTGMTGTYVTITKI